MSRFVPERQTVRLRNGSVAAVSGSKVTVTLDGTSIPNVPVHGPVPGVGTRVLLLEQGSSLLVMGSAVSELTALRAELTELQGLVRELIGRSHDG